MRSFALQIMQEVCAYVGATTPLSCPSCSVPRPPTCLGDTLQPCCSLHMLVSCLNLPDSDKDAFALYAGQLLSFPGSICAVSQQLKTSRKLRTAHASHHSRTAIGFSMGTV